MLKQSAKAHKWKFSRGDIFKATDLLFFSIGILGRANLRHLSYSLSYKLLAFDDLFWTIVKLEENVKQPLSFRASGAWTAPMTTVAEGKLPIADWNVDNLQMAVNEIISRCQLDVEQLSQEIQGLDDNLRVLERLYIRHKADYPNTNKTLWIERLLTSILKNEYRDSKKIVRDRIESDDRGGFLSGSKSFYQLADEYLTGRNV